MLYPLLILIPLLLHNALLHLFLIDFVLKVYFSCNEYCHPTVLFPLAWNVFFHPLTFSRCVSLALKWVFCKQHIDFFHVKMHSFSFWLEHLIHLHWKWLLISMSLMQFCYLYPGCFVVLLFSLSFSFFICVLIIFFSIIFMFLSL